MDDKNLAQPPRQPQPEEQPSDPTLNNTQNFSSAPFVPDEYEPATERSQYAAPETTPQPTTSGFVVPNTEQPATPQYEFTPPPLPPKKRKKSLIIGSVAALVAVLLIGGAVAAYKLWYQNPDKVISDAVVNVLKAKTLTYAGNLSVDFDGGRVVIDMDGSNPNLTSGELNVRATISHEGKDYKVNGSGMVDKDGTFYVKLSNVREIVDTLMKEYGMTTRAFDSFIAKVDGKWVKISSDDISDLDEETGTTQKCVTDTLNKFNDDETAKQEVADLYKKNPFLLISNDLEDQSIGGVDSMGYTITSDHAKAEAFAADVNASQLGKDLQSCDKDIKLDTSDDDKDSASSDTTTTVTAWVSRWSHEFTRLKVEGESDDNKGSFTLDPIFNKAVTLETPKDVLTLKDLEDELDKATEAYQDELYDSYYMDMNESAPTPQA